MPILLPASPPPMVVMHPHRYKRCFASACSDPSPAWLTRRGALASGAPATILRTCHGAYPGTALRRRCPPAHPADQPTVPRISPPDVSIRGFFLHIPHPLTRIPMAQTNNDANNQPSLLASLCPVPPPGPPRSPGQNPAPPYSEKFGIWTPRGATIFHHHHTPPPLAPTPIPVPDHSHALEHPSPLVGTCPDHRSRLFPRPGTPFALPPRSSFSLSLIGISQYWDIPYHRVAGDPHGGSRPPAGILG